MLGVELRLLDRREEEVVCATSVVRKGPVGCVERHCRMGTELLALATWARGTGSQPHSHPSCKEIDVLSRVFQDALGVYPAGSCLRDRPGSVHPPLRAFGCTIWM